MSDESTRTTPQRPDLKRARVADQLRSAIISGAYDRGSLLPGENELAQRFSVSRGTIRNALAGLAEDKLINTRTGVGSFVTFDGRPLNQPASWGVALAGTAVRPRPEILRMECVTDPELAAEVGSPGMRFLALDRVRHVADGRAVSLERSRVPAVGPLAAAAEDGLMEDSLSATMAAAGLVPASGEQWISVVPLGAADAEVFGREAGATFLHIIRIARDSRGEFIEKVSSLLDPDRFRIHSTFGGPPA